MSTVYMENEAMPFVEACPVTQRVIVISPVPGGIYELVRDLSEGCFDVMVFHHREEGIRNALSADLLIFDLTRYREQDAAIVRSLGSVDTGGVPILYLIREDMLGGMDEDYKRKELLVWPCRPQELVYHTQRIIRSSEGKRPVASRLLAGTSPAIFKDLWVDRKKMAVYRKGEQIDLTKTEYDLFIQLLESEGSVMTREDLLASVWGTTFLGGSNVVDVHIKSLRKKLGDRAASPDYIATVRGVGYRLAD
ncbi:winged helix-turn-helix transcriptional regulator [Paenibacillus physcomitrellae]|uniref:DNA-binding response regulator n=1 Tax=Paenibacillus physcomitrellae TaxID=1619311 RepID=A0ABQ1GF24_9BACL|nr:response regulator transcription factor [Paenibacillus physcomitrellae]GGA42545.1 DNA-binding response regulator [Paenibacillus physcomitrellae]